MVRSLLLLCAALAVISVAECASSLRFVNAVPATVSTFATTSRAAQQVVYTSAATAAISISTLATGPIPPNTATSTNAALAGTRNTEQDVVGLRLFTSSTVFPAGTSTIVNTVLNCDVTAALVDLYGEWHNGLLPLRGDHNVDDGTTVAVATTTVQSAVVNRICVSETFAGAFTAVDVGDGAATETVDGARGDHYVGEQLRADGLMGYLSFAAGTYDIGAYGVVGGNCGTAGGCTITTATVQTTPTSRTVRDFTASRTSVVVQDNKIYTIIAYGTGDWTGTGSANTVKLAFSEERTASAKFNHGAIRFFHAISSVSRDSLSVYSGRSVAGAVLVAEGVAFGGFTEYVDVRSFSAQIFPISASSGVLASGTTVTAQVQAGLVATSICSINDLNLAAPFCRMIPSRVVAYVRLAHDFNNQLLINDGALTRRGAEVTVGLFAGYQAPHPETVGPYRTAITSPSAPTTAPIFTVGAYPVVSGVKASTVSDFGEVHVPLPIMDQAILPRISVNMAATTVAATAALGGTAGVAGLNNKLIYKRVTLHVITSGGSAQHSTLLMTGASVTGNAAVKTVTVAATVQSQMTTSTYNVDAEEGIIANVLNSVFLEPGTANIVSWTPTYGGAQAGAGITAATQATLLAQTAHNTDDVMLNFACEASCAQLYTIPANGGGSFVMGTTTMFQSLLNAGTGATALTGADTIFLTTNGIKTGTAITVASTWSASLQQMGPSDGAGAQVDGAIGVAPWNVLHIPRAFDTTGPGAYVYVRGTNTADVLTATICSVVSPEIAFTVEADSIVSVYAMNAFSCIANAGSTTTGSTVSKNAYAAKWQLASAPAAAPASAAAATPFFGAASTASAPFALLAAAVVIVAAVAL